ncbi:hypothetical protein [Vibrio cincinnatiensis]|uniref:hypothetical protein n=1 Tax=Vibrio cincinnatiensis TaxID=675 RepID=UPI00389C388B
MNQVITIAVKLLRTMKPLSLLLIGFFPLIVSSAEVTELSIDAGTCSLKERGITIKEQAISIDGIKRQGHGCLAFIMEDDFDEKFNFCVYSGFEVAGELPNYYACSISKENNSYMFRAYAEGYEERQRKADLICRFMCFNK